ncbi:MAG TPA: hypothetical protein DEB31_00305 [Clostridiales bacterium]|nr:hypothetical protein [Clostridiales bacterium]
MNDMSQYRIMIADDAEKVRKSIIVRIDWAELGFALVGEASNGLEALEVAERLNPDIIITNIKMPYMDGLQMLEAISHTLPAAKLLVISGFDDFEYAQRAIRLGVTEYMLKPISAAQMEEALLRLKSGIDAEMEERRNIDGLRKSYEESLPILRDRFLSGLMESKLTDRQLREGLARYGIALSGEAWVAAIARHTDSAALFGQQKELIPLSVRRIAEDTLRRNGFDPRILIKEDEVWILADMRADQTALFTECLRDVYGVAKKAVMLHMCVGVSSVKEALTDAGAAFAEARNALGYCSGSRDDQCMVITDIEPELAKQFYLAEQHERAIADAVKLSDEGSIRTVLAKVFAEAERSNVPYSGFQLFALEVYTVLLRMAHIYGLPPAQVFGESSTPEYIFATFSNTLINEWLVKAAVTANRLIRNIHSNTGRELADSAKDIIANHYENPPLSLEWICGQLSVSGPYFSKVFKQAEGVNFIVYLTNLRLERAVDLLNTTPMKTYEIAERVGYPDPNYFSYVFKKKYGVSPSKFRSQDSR